MEQVPLEMGLEQEEIQAQAQELSMGMERSRVLSLALSLELAPRRWHHTERMMLAGQILEEQRQASALVDSVPAQLQKGLRWLQRAQIWSPVVERAEL